jgi:hypothetical protein
MSLAEDIGRGVLALSGEVEPDRVLPIKSIAVVSDETVSRTSTSPSSSNDGTVSTTSR